MVALSLLGLLMAGCSGKSETAPASSGSATAQAVAAADADPDKQRRTATERRLAAGMAYLQVQDLEGARRHITRALELDPGSGAANNAMALLYRAEGDRKREEEYYRRALRKEPSFSAARNNYATLLYAEGRYKEAAEHLERAAEDVNYDQRGMAFYNLGRCRVRLGDLEGADAAFQRAVRLDSRRPEPLLAMAELGLQRARYREAWAYYQNWTAARTKQTAGTLLLGIRIAEKVGNKDAVASYELQFDKFFSGTPQHKAWKAWRAGGPEPGVASGDGAL
jgi:type IV pilus assembly protein PilF